MPDLAIPLPTRRPDLVSRPLGESGPYVVKDPRTGDYYHLGEQEHFLLTQLDGRQSGAAVCAAFGERFGEPLSEGGLQDFLEMVKAQGLVQAAGDEGTVPAVPRPPRSGSLLSWRKKLFDPDRLLTWLEPRLRFCFTWWFLVVSAGAIVFAL